jgi:hypothetical protein
MTTTRNLWHRYRQLPRAGQWAIAATVAVALILIWTDHVMVWATAWNEQADELLNDARDAAGGERRVSRVDGLRNTIQGLGPVQRPGQEAQAEMALNDAVNEVLKRHTVSRDSFNYRGPTKLPRGTLSRVIRSGDHVEQITGDLRFDSTPEAAIAIIAELESSPALEAVSDVRIMKQAGSHKVTVDLTVASWIVSRERRSRRVGGA